MSTPHPEELATLIALPPAAREALARCEGPGWHVTDDGMALPLSESPNPFRVRFAWLPCDTAEILAPIPGPRLLMCDGGTYIARAGPLWQIEGRGETARLAALRLLAAVAS